MGTVYVYRERERNIDKKINISPQDEIEKFDKAIGISKEELFAIRENTLQSLSKEHAQIFDAHLEILADPWIVDETIAVVKQQEVSASYALHMIREEIIDIFANMDDTYMKERSNDILDVTNRVLGHLLGHSNGNIEVSEGIIIVAHDLTPSFTATVDRDKVIGFVTYAGGATSHTAIMARSLGIPAIVGVPAEGKIATGDMMIIDAEAGHIVLNPTPELIADYAQKMLKLEELEAYYKQLTDTPAVTATGKKINLYANIGNPSDLQFALANGAEGIGLFRSEFLFMHSTSAPSENEQFEVYKSVVQGMKGKPVTIRTLDVGGDKVISYLNLPKEENPFLGYRAIRISLAERGLFRTQIRALLRASAFGYVKIMLPLITSVDELITAKKIMEQEKQQLMHDGKAVGRYEVGVMIETPASVFIAPQLAEHSDFFSIGTNDLIQYVLVVDRMNEKVAHYYNPMHPAVLLAIKQVIEVGAKANIDVSMCGEMAGDEAATQTLLELGLQSFSMSASSIPKVKAAILNKIH